MTVATEPIRHPLPRVGGVLEVAAVVRSSVVDGPGMRAVVFLQGCNFDCLACQNPSTIGRCTGCGVCVDACPHGALFAIDETTVEFTPVSCDGCAACLAVCPIDADPTVRPLAIGRLLQELRTASSFLTGVTVTGGEPTLQLEGLIELFGSIRSDPDLAHLTTLVDTNGTLDRAGWERLLPHLDGAMVDLKAGSDRLHRELTGHGAARVRESIVYLHRRGRLAEIRLLVIPGVTDTDDELTAWARFVRRVDATVPVRLMGFRHTGTRPRAHGWREATEDDIDRASSVLAGHGLANLIWASPDTTKPVSRS